MPRMTATRAPGTFGAKSLIPNTRINAITPTTTVVMLASGRLVIHAHIFCHALLPEDSVPVILNSSPAATLIATPKVNPVSTLEDRNSEIHPILSRYMMMNISPVTRTIAAATATASSLPEEATARTPAPRTAAVDELGPSVTCLEVVKSAKAIRPTRAA